MARIWRTIGTRVRTKVDIPFARDQVMPKGTTGIICAENGKFKCDEDPGLTHEDGRTLGLYFELNHVDFLELIPEEELPTVEIGPDGRRQEVQE